MYDPEADVRMLYQAYSSQIEFSKDHQWKSAYYGIWTIAGLAGLFRLFGPFWPGAFIFPFFTVLALFFSVYNLLKNWCSIRKARVKYKYIALYLSGRFSRIIGYPPDYLKVKYDIFFPIAIGFTLLVGSILVTLWMVSSMALCREQFRLMIILLSLMSVVCLAHLSQVWTRERCNWKRYNNAYERDKNLTRSNAL